MFLVGAHVKPEFRHFSHYPFTPPSSKQSPLKREHFEHRGVHVFPEDLRPLPPTSPPPPSRRMKWRTSITVPALFKHLFPFFLPLCCLSVCSVCFFYTCLEFWCFGLFSWGWDWWMFCSGSWAFFPLFLGGLKLHLLPPGLIITIAMLIICQKFPTQCLLILNNTPGPGPLTHSATLQYTGYCN